MRINAKGADLKGKTRGVVKSFDAIGQTAKP